jgi:hypothetical protein
MLTFSAAATSQITTKARETWTLVNGLGRFSQRGKNSAD